MAHLAASLGSSSSSSSSSTAEAANDGTSGDGASGAGDGENSVSPLLDLSAAGRQAWEAALEEYDVQMDAMEERLARLLRDKLTACQVRFLLLFFVTQRLR
jgi:hypothetical protein